MDKTRMYRTANRSGMVIASWVLASLLSLSGCKAMSVEKEAQLGNNAAADIERKVRLDSGPRADRVARIGRTVADATGNRDYTFTYKVINDPKFNAFAVPGGRIYIYSGMLDRLSNDDELAGVPAATVISRSPSRRRSFWPPFDPMRPFGSPARLPPEARRAGRRLKLEECSKVRARLPRRPRTA